MGSDFSKSDDPDDTEGGQLELFHTPPMQSDMTSIISIPSNEPIISVAIGSHDMLALTSSSTLYHWSSSDAPSRNLKLHPEIPSIDGWRWGWTWPWSSKGEVKADSKSDENSWTLREAVQDGKLEKIGTYAGVKKVAVGWDHFLIG